jgi:dTDP-4-amino-4,6-dideoxygalactose transaminase
MIEMQAAIGRIQLRRMAAWTAARTRNADIIRAAVAPFSGDGGAVRAPRLEGAGNVHAEYKHYAYVRPDRLADGWDRDRIVAEINARGVPCFQGSCSEVYLEKAFDDTGLRPLQRLPVARTLGETSLMWLVHPTLTEEQVALTAAVTQDVLYEASRAS